MAQHHMRKRLAATRKLVAHNSQPAGSDSCFSAILADERRAGVGAAGDFSILFQRLVDRSGENHGEKGFFRRYPHCASR